LAKEKSSNPVDEKSSHQKKLFKDTEIREETHGSPVKSSVKAK
jgi:hypothetical protein